MLMMRLSPDQIFLDQSEEEECLILGDSNLMESGLLRSHEKGVPASRRRSVWQTIGKVPSTMPGRVADFICTVPTGQRIWSRGSSQSAGPSLLAMGSQHRIGHEVQGPCGALSGSKKIHTVGTNSACGIGQSVASQTTTASSTTKNFANNGCCCGAISMSTGHTSALWHCGLAITATSAKASQLRATPSQVTGSFEVQ